MIGLRVWTLRVEQSAQSFDAEFCSVLDEAERAQASRFMFTRDRIAFVAAHVLVRYVLSSMIGDADPASWRFVAGAKGKPTAWLDGAPAPLSFNLSHTEGLVGLATVAAPGCALGFDLEALDRKVTPEFADRWFRPEEAQWLRERPAAERPEGFVRLWTLKEAFIKATGQGLSQDLTAFWFTPFPPRIHFTPAIPERTDAWHFEQRVIGRRFMAALGFRRPPGTPVTVNWTEVDTDGFWRRVALSPHLSQ